MPRYLDQRPTDSAVIDELRVAAQAAGASRISGEWKAELHEAYRSNEAAEHVWHLPDGRTLRVVTTPNPDGGVTYLFHDVTERLDLERRFEELIRVQGETLDNLAEGVAVFGSDGRLRLHNTAFARMWKLSPRGAAPTGRISKRSRRYAGRCTATIAIWQALRAVVTAIDSREADHRAARTPRRQRGRLHHCAAARRRHAGHVPRRHRLRQRRTRAARTQRSARGGRPDQGRLRASRVLRAALAADQHHRLRASARRSGDRAAGAKAARISRLHHRLDRMRCWRSSTTFSISPPSMPAACSSISDRSTSAKPCRRPPRACRTAW